MNKTYLSLAISRQLANEFPVGDPFGGPAYGERNMPIVAGVVAAAGVLGTAITGGVVVGGAMAIAGAAVTVVAAAAVVAGLAMTVVGAITGDKDLMKIGAIVGIAGGVAGLAGGAISGAAAGAAEVGASAAEVAVPAASSTATTAAKGGLLSSSNAMSNAITPAFSSVGTQALGAAPVLTDAAGIGSTLSTIGQVGSIGSTAAQAISPQSKGGTVQPSTYIPQDSLSTSTPQSKSADTTPSTYITQESFSAPVVSAPKMPITIGASAPNAPDGAKDITKSSSSYFDELMSPKNLAQMTGPALVGIGKGVISGIGSKEGEYYEAAMKNANTKQDELNYKKEQDAKAYANANTQGYNGMTTRALTQEEYDQAKLNKARMANQTAGLLTQSA